jgi:2-polyprenyl-6-methoxyphenol hydroxylase-like FAD-dependent oxidoreductase
VTPRILISGAGIAGLAHALWLKQVGLEPVVIDRAPSFRALGHYIALKGNGVEVVRQMGLEAACRAREAKFSLIKFLTPQWFMDREARAFYHSETLRAAPRPRAGPA